MSSTGIVIDVFYMIVLGFCIQAQQSPATPIRPRKKICLETEFGADPYPDIHPTKPLFGHRYGTSFSDN